MKINTNKTYKAIKEQFAQKKAKLKQEAQERIKEAQEYIEPKVKETFSKAEGWSDEFIKNSKETYSKTKQKIQPKVDEFIASADSALNPPKAQVLKENVKKLEKKFFQKQAFLSDLKTRFPDKQTLILEREKELKKLEQNVLSAIEKLKKFTEKESAVQKAFERLNK